MNDFQRLLKYVRPYWPIFVLALIAMVVNAIMETAIGGLLVPIVDQFVPNAGKTKTLFNLDSLIPKDDWYLSWIIISSLLLGFTVIKDIAEYFSSYLMARIGQSAILNLRNELYDHLLGQSTGFFEKHRTNFLVSRLVVSCSAIELAVSTNLRDVLREACMLVFFVAAAFYFNWRLMLGALLLGPILGFVTSFVSDRVRKFADESLEGNKILNDTAQETLANQTIVKAYTAETRERSRFSKVAHSIARANIRTTRIASMSPPVIDIVGTTALVLLFYFGLREINAGRMDPGQFFAFLFFLARSYEPLRKISRQHNEISKGFAAARDVWNVLDIDESIPERPNAVKLEPLRKGIRIEDLSFVYQDIKGPVLNEISLEIPKGSVVPLVGESGGGKSSLVRLIQRLYDPTKGAIFWDDTDLRDAELLSLKRQIGLVTQETVLFNDTIRHNIAYGKPDATDAEIENAARIAFADEFIDQLPDRYETLVGERGMMLSGGQRQRIAIARAVLIDAHVLILDEATSALDTESERLVQQAISNLMQNKTSIVIAHRLSTIRSADKIVVMEKGRIVEVGTHDELLKKEDRYKRLHDFQFAVESHKLDDKPDNAV